MERFDPGFLDRSDWHVALAPVAAALRAHDDFPSAEALSEIARTRGLPLRFELQTKAPSRRSAPVDPSARYDGRITLDGVVPTREASWHDVYNALVFLAFPRAKRALHARQHRAAVEAIPKGATRVPGKRTREQDCLTILDEGSLLVGCPPGERDATERALRARGARALIDTRLRPVVFGHAIYEHFHHGRPPIRAMTIVLELDDASSTLEGLDEALARRVEDTRALCDPSEGFSILLEARRSREALSLPSEASRP